MGATQNVQELRWKQATQKDRLLDLAHQCQAQKYDLLAMTAMKNEIEGNGTEFVRLGSKLWLTADAVGIMMSQRAQLGFREAGSKFRAFCNGTAIAILVTPLRVSTITSPESKHAPLQDIASE